jgi:hypothetical protein
MSTRPFESERAVFDAHRDAWLADDREGWWVAIRAHEIAGPFARPEETWEAAIEKFGKPGFFMRQITREDRPAVVTQVRFPTERASS